MESKTIVAIEIASSKIKGAAGTVDADGRVTILAVEEIGGINNVRYGRVQNIREVSAAVNEIVRRLEAAPTVKPRTVRAVAVALGGRSLCGVPARAAQKFPKECEISERHIERLAFEASRDFMGDKSIEDTVARRFYVNNSAVRHPVGIFGESLRGEFMMISCNKENRQNLERIKYDSLDPGKVTYVIRPTAIADMVLSAEEKELGSALVDIGAETTTVAVYKEGTLAAVFTLPLGARLISYDLSAGFNVTEETAEAMKRNYTAGVDVNNGELVGKYIDARAGEIVANVLNMLTVKGFAASALSKIVLTGGGANIPAFAALLASQGKVAVRTAAMPEGVSFRVAGRNSSDNIDVVALILAGSRRMTEDCLSKAESEEPRAESEGRDGECRVEDEPGVDSRDAASRVEAEEEPAEESVAESQVPDSRRDIDEDDPSLYADDPDDDEEEQSHSGRRLSFSGLFGRKNKERKEEAPAQPQQRRAAAPTFSQPDIDAPFEDSSDVEAEDDVLDTQSRPQTRSATKRAGATISSIQDSIWKLFSTSDPEEAENADEDDY